MAMPATERWTLERLDALPDDGNRYELVDGELVVTPPPSEAHEGVLAWLDRVIAPFVYANGLGWVHHPKSVVQRGEERTEPDLMVRPDAPFRGWANAPVPLLVVEVLSPSTRKKDLERKRSYYMRSGVAEYWIVDQSQEVVTQVRPGNERRISTVLRWAPEGTPAVLEIDVGEMFAHIRSRLEP